MPSRISRSDSFVPNGTISTSAGAGWVAIVPRRQVTANPAAARASLSIAPSSPVEWLVMQRTASIGSKAGPQVTRAVGAGMPCDTPLRRSPSTPK